VCLVLRRAAAALSYGAVHLAWGAWAAAAGELAKEDGALLEVAKRGAGSLIWCFSPTFEDP